MTAKRVPVLVAALVLTALAARAEERWPFESCFEIAARLHGVPMETLLAVAATESNWNPDARSHADAHGLMQIRWPRTAAHLGVTRLAELYNPCLNIELGARYLRELTDRYAGDENRALAAYNYGPGRIAAEDALPAGARRYVQTVARHRERIRGRVAADVVATTHRSRQAVLVFASARRAEGFAARVNRDLVAARLVVAPDPDGGYRVTLAAAAEELQLADANRLRAVGWTAMNEEGTP